MGSTSPKTGSKLPIESGLPLPQRKRANGDLFKQTKRIRLGVSADPNQITKIELCCTSAIRVEVRIYSELYAEAEIFEFPDKENAIDFCRKIWLRRW